MSRSIQLALLALSLLTPAAGAGEPDVVWLAQARAQLEEELHAFAPDEAGGVRTRSPRHGIRARLGADGMAVEHPDGSLSFTLRGFGRGDELAPLGVASVAFDAQRAQLDHGELVEWWTNGPAGMEQGFDVPRPPACGAHGPLVLELELGGSLGARLVDGGSALAFRAAGREVLRYSKLAAFDAAGEALSARMSLADGALRLEVEDAGARYPITVDPLLSSPAWSVESDDTLAYLGWSAATAGDVNGDGYSDVIVGAPLYDSLFLDDFGAAFLYLGSASGLSTTWSWKGVGTEAFGRFGHSVAGVGDVNGDGFDDLLVGEPDALAGAGRAALFHGDASGTALTLAWSVAGGAPDERLGTSVAYAGDVNADGFADLIVGSPGWDFIALEDVGRADVYLGSPTGPAATPDWSALGDYPDAALGFSVATAGDVDADGFDDVIVGEPHRSNGGRALVFGGGQGGVDASALWTYSPGISPGSLGWSVATAGDVNRDGYADVVVGSPYRWASGNVQAGAAMVFHGGPTGPSSQYDWWTLGTREYETLGRCVATAGDVNGDGYADVALGAPGLGDQLTTGRGRVFHGGPGGLGVEPEWEHDGTISYAAALGTAGDVDGDGFSDVIVGEYAYADGQLFEGAAHVHHGSAGTPVAGDTDDGTGAGGGFGYSVADAGDVDGDGLSDVIVGAPRADALATDGGYLRLYLGREDLQLVSAWEYHGDNAGALLGISVDGAGDVNGDGYDDVIAGTRFYTDGEPNEGAAFVFHGGPAGLGASWSTLLELDVPGAGFGNSVSSAGDVNGDGYGDVIVGAPFTATPGPNEHGRAYVFLGSPQGVDPVPVWSYDGDGSLGQSWFGHSVGCAGDVNGDGYSDVVVGEPLWSTPGAVYGGRAHVFHGSPEGPAAQPAWTSPAGAEEQEVGWSVSGAGDVNGDGYSDVLVGAPSWTDDSDGRAYVAHGSAAGLSPSWDVEVLSYIPNSELGGSVAAAGDLDGDGYGDVVLGAPAALSWAGRAQVQFGSPSGLSATADFLTDGGMQWGMARGLGVGGGGDFDGDGFADLLVGAPHLWGEPSDPGHVGILAGNSSDGGPALRARLPEQEHGNGGRIPLRGRAKVPGTLAVSVRAHSPAGRARVRLEWQLAERGESFAGQATRAGAWSDTGAPDAIESAAPITEVDDQLVYDEVYAWRARVTSRNPLFPHGPWLSAAGNSPTEGKLSTRVGQSAGFTGAKKQNP